MLTVEDIKAYEAANGPIPGSGAIFRLAPRDGGKYIPTKKRYMGTDKKPGTLRAALSGLLGRGGRILMRIAKFVASRIEPQRALHWTPANSKDFPAVIDWARRNKPGLSKTRNADKLPTQGRGRYFASR